MDIKTFLKQSKMDNERQLKIYEERNKGYGSKEDTLIDNVVVASICFLWDIDPCGNAVDTDWFRLVDKLTRHRIKPKLDNLDNAMNYIRRIMAAEKEKGLY
jgi:hypothetical protein